MDRVRSPAAADERVADAVSRLTLPEKICSLDTSGCPNPSLGLPDYNWWSEASTGVDNGQRGTEATKFPYPITTASTARCGTRSATPSGTKRAPS